MSNHQERVSPWEIDSSVSLPPLSIQSSPRLKKLRTSQQAPSVLDSHFAGTDLTFLNPFVLCCHYVVWVLRLDFFLSLNRRSVGDRPLYEGLRTRIHYPPRSHCVGLH